MLFIRRAKSADHVGKIIRVYQQSGGFEQAKPVTCPCMANSGHSPHHIHQQVQRVLSISNVPLNLSKYLLILYEVDCRCLVSWLIFSLFVCTSSFSSCKIFFLISHNISNLRQLDILPNKTYVCIVTLSNGFVMSRGLLQSYCNTHFRFILHAARFC